MPSVITENVERGTTWHIGMMCPMEGWPLHEKGETRLHPLTKKGQESVQETDTRDLIPLSMAERQRQIWTARGRAAKVMRSSEKGPQLDCCLAAIKEDPMGETFEKG